LIGYYITVGNSVLYHVFQAEANLGPDYNIISVDATERCVMFSPAVCKMVNADSYTLFLAAFANPQLIWVFMLLFTQFIQLSRGMTTYENMFGIKDGTATSAFTSTGTPLDPNHPSISATGDIESGHGHKHHQGMLKQWSRMLGVDPFIETITGRGAATGKNRRKVKNPYSRGCVTNCRDFWCEPAPVFGQKENGMAVLGGEPVDYTAMYESPVMMRLTGMRGRGGYESVGTEEV
jgi:hypothetical protein